MATAESLAQRFGAALQPYGSTCLLTPRTLREAGAPALPAAVHHADPILLVAQGSDDASVRPWERATFEHATACPTTSAGSRGSSPARRWGSCLLGARRGCAGGPVDSPAGRRVQLHRRAGVRSLVFVAHAQAPVSTGKPVATRGVGALTASQNVQPGLRVTGRAARPQLRRRADAMLEAVRLGAHRHKRADQLSGGQRQRVARSSTAYSTSRTAVSRPSRTPSSRTRSR